MVDVIDIQPEEGHFSYATFKTVEREGYFRQGLIISLPNPLYVAGDLIFNNLDGKEKEKLFNILDMEFHDKDETSNSWQDRALNAELQNEKKDEEIEQLRNLVAELQFRG